MLRELFSQAAKLQEEAAELCRYLHANAEVGMNTEKTLGFIESKLTELGLQPERCGCGLIADIGVGEGSTLLRADIDALPIKENSGELFAAKTGAMHACGHDMHAAMLLTAAKLITERKIELKFPVRLMFQPGEELLTGAYDMIEHGALKGVRRAATLHVLTAIPLKTGTVLLPPAGVTARAAQFFKVDITGADGHAAFKTVGKNALLAAVNIANELCSARIGGGNITVTRLQSGSGCNITPKTAEIMGSIRSFDACKLKGLKRLVCDIVNTEAGFCGVGAKVCFLGGAPALKNDAVLRDKTAKMLKGHVRFIEPALTDGGSEDFAHIAKKVPSIMLAIAAGDMREGYIHPAHSDKARFDEAALGTGAAVYAAMAFI